MVTITIIETRYSVRKGIMIIHPKASRIIISPSITLEGKDTKKGDKILQDIRNIICENFKTN